MANRGQQQRSEQYIPEAKPFKINGIIRGLGYMSNLYMGIVGILMLIGRAADIESVNPTLNIIVTTMFVVCFVIAFLVLKLIDSINGNV